MGRKFYQKTWFILLMTIFFTPIGIILALVNPFYSFKTKKIIGGSVVAIILITVVYSNLNPQGGKYPRQSQEKTQSAQSQSEEKEHDEKSEQARIEQQKQIEREKAEQTEKARKEAELANKRKSDNVIEIIHAVEDIEISYESTKKYANFTAIPDSEKAMTDRMNELNNKLELFDTEILGKFIEFTDASKKDELSSEVYNLYAEDRYGDFLMKPINAIRVGNILREDALPKEYHSKKYGYEIINGFLNGNTNYPVLNYATDSIYKFDHTRKEKENNVVVLDVKSVVYHNGFVYVNIIGLKREIAFGSDDKKSDWKLIETCSPSLFRFMILSAEDAKKGNYIPLNNSTSQNIKQFDDIDILHEEASLDSSSWQNIQRDIKEWYNPSIFGKEAFRNPRSSSCLHLQFGTQIEELKAPWNYRYINSSNSYFYRDIFLFAIYKLLKDVEQKQSEFKIVDNEDSYVVTTKTGIDCYVINDTIKWIDDKSFTVIIKIAKSPNEITKMHYFYELSEDMSGAKFQDSYDGSGQIYNDNDNGHPVEYSIYKYVLSKK